LIAVAVTLRVSAFRLAMTDKIENFNLSFPCSLTLEKLLSPPRIRREAIRNHASLGWHL
jgi:hypothetical protein